MYTGGEPTNCHLTTNNTQMLSLSFTSEALSPESAVFLSPIGTPCEGQSTNTFALDLACEKGVVSPFQHGVCIETALLKERKRTAAASQVRDSAGHVLSAIDNVLPSVAFLTSGLINRGSALLVAVSKLEVTLLLSFFFPCSNAASTDIQKGGA